MNRVIRQLPDKVKQSRSWLNQSKQWPLILIASIAWGIVGWQIYRTEFLAGFWGITNDEIAVVTIEKDGGEDTSTETIIIQDPSKSFWDGLQLLGVIGIPVVIAITGNRFQKSQQEQAERIAKKQREQDAAETREEVLQLYFDRISALLIDKNLMAIAAKGTPNTAIILAERSQLKPSTNEKITPEQQELLEASLDVIRARTLSILRRFEKDIDRKNSVLRFLAEAEIISKLKLNLKGADLKGTDLRGARLEGAILDTINFNDETIWPTKKEVAKAKNVPIELQQKLGLIPELPQTQPTDQHPPTSPQ